MRAAGATGALLQLQVVSASFVLCCRRGGKACGKGVKTLVKKM